MAKKRQQTAGVVGRAPLQQRVAVNLDAPTAAKQARRHRITTWAIWANVFVLVPLLVLVGAFYLSERVTGKSEAAQASSTQVNGSGGKASATLAIERWLARTPAPLPDGALVSWDGFETREAPPLPDNAPEGTQRPDYVQELHRFTLTDGKRLYDSEVLVNVHPAHGAKVIGTPTLLPRAAYNSAGWGSEVPWFGFDQNTDTGEADTAVEVWVAAFTSGSPKKLKQTVGDPHKNSAYVPLSGVKSAKFTITNAGTKTAENDDEPEPDWMIARVEIELTWEGQDEPEPGEQLTHATYDVLITDIDSATPKVVSWGGPGTGPSLKPYSVALTGVTLKEPGENDSDSDTPGNLGLNDGSGEHSDDDAEDAPEGE